MSALASLKTQTRRWLGRAREHSWVVPIERDHWQTQKEFRRRQWVTAATIVVGTPLLRKALNQAPGSRAFYTHTVALASVWGGGALLSGPLHAGWSSTRVPDKKARPVIRPVTVGAVAVAGFAAIAALVAPYAVFRRPMLKVLDHARFGSLPVVIPLTILTGVGEELFFRGALYAGTKNPYQIAVTTVAYAAITAVTGNPMLVLAAGALGALVGIERRTTGGVQGPIVIHMTWSTGMLLVLPPIIEARR